MRKITDENTAKFQVAGAGKRNFTAAVETPAEAPAAVTASLMNLQSYTRDPYFQVSRELSGHLAYDPISAHTLAEFLEDGERHLDPVDVFDIDGFLFLVHGFTRSAAYEIAGRTVIPAIVHKGTREQAFEFALRVNVKTTRPLTDADKWKRVRAAFAHYGFLLSNHEIARRLDHAVTAKFCGTVRAAIEAETAAAKLIATLAPGTPDAPAPDEAPDEAPAPNPDIRMVTRGGKTYPMKASKIGKNQGKAKADPAPAPVPAPVAAPVARIEALPDDPAPLGNGRYVGAEAPLAELPDLVTADDGEIITLEMTRKEARYLRFLLAQDYSDVAEGIRDALQLHDI